MTDQTTTFYFSLLPTCFHREEMNYRPVLSQGLSPNYLNITFYPAFHHLLTTLTTSSDTRNMGLICMHFYCNIMYHIMLTKTPQCFQRL